MRTVRIGETSVGVIGLGTWQFGAQEWGFRPEERREALRIVRRALRLGANLIDTAELYGRGESERIIGEALAEAGQRGDEVTESPETVEPPAPAFIASKVMPFPGTTGRVLRAASASLARLRLAAIDLYQLHWPNPAFPLGWQVAGLRRLLDDGRIRHAGVSNYSARRWERAEALLGRPIIANQVHYSLLRRGVERDVLPWAESRGRIVLAYSPLAQGLLSGKFENCDPPRDVRRMYWRFYRLKRRGLAGLLGLLREIAASHGATPAQIALAWATHRPNVIAIPGARSVRQLEENARAGSIRLREDEYAALAQASAV